MGQVTQKILRSHIFCPPPADCLIMRVVDAKKILYLSALLVLVGTKQSHSFCFESAAKRYNVAPQILKSIAQCESGMDPTAVNYNTDGSYDYGLMQINTCNEPTLRKVGISWQSLSDPCTNVMVGAWLLSQRINEYGYTWKAIGAYHSKTPAKRDAYAWKIAKTISKYTSGASSQKNNVATLMMGGQNANTSAK